MLLLKIFYVQNVMALTHSFNLKPYINILDTFKKKSVIFPKFSFERE